MSGGMGGGMPRVQRQSKFELFADRLRLNKDQKDEVQAIFTDALKEGVRCAADAIASFGVDALRTGTSC